MQTAEDIINDEPLDITLKLDHVDTADHETIECWIHFVDCNGQFVKCTIFKDSDYSGYDWGSAEYYEFKQAIGDIYQENIGIKPSWKTEITPLDTAPPAFESSSDPADTPVSTDGEAPSSGDARLALDIEVLTPVPESKLDLSDPTHIELLCIGVGYQPAPGLPPETTVLFRTGATPEHELELLEDFCEWIDARSASTLLTFGGESFDLSHLHERTRLAEKECKTDRELESRISDTVGEFASIDLKPTAKQAFGYSSSLESTCRQAEVSVTETHWDIYNHSLNPEAWRKKQQNEGSNSPPKSLNHRNVLGSDVPFIGEHYLELIKAGNQDTVEARAIRELLRSYTQSDIDPLFFLAEREPFISNTAL